MQTCRLQTRLRLTGLDWKVTVEMFRAKLPDSDRVLRLPPARLLSNLHLAIRQVEQPPPPLPPAASMLDYCRSHKRRLVDSCGHERCYSCIGNNKNCILCQEMGESLSASNLPAAHLLLTVRSGAWRGPASREPGRPQEVQTGDCPGPAVPPELPCQHSAQETEDHPEKSRRGRQEQS